ncbi:glutathione S-transferase family protein [Ancylobacter oerskovii]|uniref:Glutathione S-transferase family protein n=1 Tax=Ancylobacter oerskovii TaxID=459519 RepID=A0ABW4YUF5_9HYPH|nr:glutathione S-transferase family protein [Ancylobacter oerskovii]MBS7544516.1 glutathione S-transferase family protein [Ancylobacter oerskovii]
MQLYHHPFCQFSRMIRLALGEMGMDPELIEERVWERRPGFLMLDPAGQTPVLVEADGLVVPGGTVAAEYLDETYGHAMGDRRLLPTGREERVEVRRLMAWFNEKFYFEVSEPLVREKVYKRFMPREAGGGPPDMPAIRAARANIRYHLHYIGWLLKTRNWLAGDRLSYADLAAAAHISCVDYLGDVPWNEDETAKIWYARIKSRPAFRPLLALTMAGMPPAACYADLDF